jgi:hypothetical protein
MDNANAVVIHFKAVNKRAVGGRACLGLRAIAPDERSAFTHLSPVNEV